MALKALKAVLRGTIDPENRRFDAAWCLEAAAPVDLTEALDLIAQVFAEDVYGHVPDGVAGSFLAVLGAELQRTKGWWMTDVRFMQHYDPGLRRLPYAILSGLVAVARMSTVAQLHDPLALPLPEDVLRLLRSFLYPPGRPPLGDALQSWPFPWLCRRGNMVEEFRILQVPGDDLELFGGRSMLDSLSSSGLDLGHPANRLEGVTWSEFLRHLGRDRSADGPQTELTASTALSALRVRCRLAAGLPVVLLGRFEESAGDVQVCDLANHLLHCPHAVPTAAPELRCHDAGEASELLEALFRQPRLVDGPITLLRVRAGTAEQRRSQVRRFAELAAPGWEALPRQNPRVVLSVSVPEGTSPHSLLPGPLHEATQFVD